MERRNRWQLESVLGGSLLVGSTSQGGGIGIGLDGKQNIIGIVGKRHEESVFQIYVSRTCRCKGRPHKERIKDKAFALASLGCRRHSGRSGWVRFCLLATHFSLVSGRS